MKFKNFAPLRLVYVGENNSLAEKKILMDPIPRNASTDAKAFANHAGQVIRHGHALGFSGNIMQRNIDGRFKVKESVEFLHASGAQFGFDILNLQGSSPINWRQR